MAKQARTNKKKVAVSESPKASYKNTAAKALSFKKTDGKLGIVDPSVHLYGKKEKVCSTNSRGYSTPDNRSPLEIVVDASDGFIPLWGEDVTLRWRFNEPSMQVFVNPDAAKDYIRQLFGEALLAWGDAAPVAFTETSDTWDFELAMSGSDNCTATGCTLARAFFPDAGRHDIMLFPILFGQSETEQVETMIHEIGHVFGLRHFFANVSETAFPSEIYGTHSRFSIMNYGADSVLTDDDKADLKQLYSEVWSGERTEINDTPIVQFRPFHESQIHGGPASAKLQLAASACPEGKAMRNLLIELLKKG